MAISAYFPGTRARKRGCTIQKPIHSRYTAAKSALFPLKRKTNFFEANRYFESRKLQITAQLGGCVLTILKAHDYSHTKWPKWAPAHGQQLRPQMSSTCISGLYHLEK